MTKKEWYQIVLQNIVIKFNSGHPNQWKKRDLELLSEAIQQETKVNLSTSTLKRIFGLIKTADEYNPYATTLEALVKYSETTDKEPRDDFQALFQQPEAEETHTKSLNSIRSFSLKSNFRLLIGVLSIILISVLAIFYFFFKSAPQNQFVELKLTKIDSKLSCSSAYFEFDISSIKDSVFLVSELNFPTYISPKQKKTSLFFNKPGRYSCYLKTKQGIISKKHPINVYSDGWEVTVNYFFHETDDRFVFIPIKEAVSENYVFHVSQQTLQKFNVDEKKEFCIMLEQFIQTNKNSDTFLFESELKLNRYRANRKCVSVMFNVVTENGNLGFRFTNEGCSKYARIQIGDSTVNGNIVDLSFLAHSFDEFTKVKILNTNKYISIYLNQTLVYEYKYAKSFGEIVGLSAIVNGDGYIKNLNLSLNNKEKPFITY